MLTVLGGLAEFERELIRARTSEGRERAKAKGVRLGRRPKLTEHQRKEAIRRRRPGRRTSLAEVSRAATTSAAGQKLEANIVKRTITIFYAWQSDTPPRFNRYLILRMALELAARSLTDGSNGSLQINIHSDTQDVPGQPPVTDTILKKIRACDIFVPDFAFVGKTKARKLLPNPNVLTEYGYALHTREGRSHDASHEYGARTARETSIRYGTLTAPHPVPAEGWRIKP